MKLNQDNKVFRYRVYIQNNKFRNVLIYAIIFQNVLFHLLNWQLDLLKTTFIHIFAHLILHSERDKKKQRLSVQDNCVYTKGIAKRPNLRVKKICEPLKKPTYSIEIFQ